MGDFLRAKAALTGVGWTTFSKNSGTTVLDLAVEAGRRAIEDAGLERADIDGVLCFHENDSAATRDVATALGLPRIEWWGDLLSGGVATVSVIMDAVQAIAAGTASHVLCYRAMNGRSGVRMGEFGLDRLGRGLNQFTHPYGFGTPTQTFAMVARRHMAEFGLTPEQLGAVAITMRNHARKNPKAMRRDEMTMVDYLGSRMIASPLRLFDCCQETDGACAVVVSAADRVRDLRHRPVYFMGGAQSGPAGARPPFDQWPDFTELWSAAVAKALYPRAGLGPADVDVALIYDAFTIFVISQLEGLGFCPRGEGGRFVEGGRIGLNGELPVNPHGGLLSEAYIHGMNHVVEAVVQLRGDAGERQVADAEVALVSGFGGAASAMILRRG